MKKPIVSKPDFAVVTLTPRSRSTPYCITFIALIGDGDEPAKKVCGRLHRRSKREVVATCREMGLDENSIDWWCEPPTAGDKIGGLR